MKINQLHMNSAGGRITCPSAETPRERPLALVFWSDLDEQGVRNAARMLRESCGEPVIVGCSTGGVIQGGQLFENALNATLVTFEHTRFETVSAMAADHPDNRALGRHLGAALNNEGLVHVFVLSDALTINGCALAAGLAEALPSHVGVTGGLAGDGERFERTTLLHGCDIFSGGVICIGFYGDRLRVSQGTRGGWVPFGPERLVTASHGNALLEIDGESALDLYERYLGKHAKNLPASGHLFPLNLREVGSSVWVVRTILGLDRERKALFFGGDVPLGSTVRLMRGSIDNLLDGAEEAGKAARPGEGKALAILVSCVGRKMLLKQFTEEEIEAVAEALGPETTLTGFYSYGEIARGIEGEPCCLHNQSMMVTVLQEIC
ncbi:FIST signal transduction protein [Desulfomicrobium salsuginis]